MGSKTEYLVTHYEQNGDIKRTIRAPLGVNPKLLLERLVCRELDDETIIASCLRKSAKRAYDPFQIIDMRDDHKRERARAALAADSETDDPIGTFNRAWALKIPVGKPLIIAGSNHDFWISEVEK